MIGQGPRPDRGNLWPDVLPCMVDGIRGRGGDGLSIIRVYTTVKKYPTLIPSSFFSRKIVSTVSSDGVIKLRLTLVILKKNYATLFSGGLPEKVGGAVSSEEAKLGLGTEGRTRGCLCCLPLVASVGDESHSWSTPA